MLPKGTRHLRIPRDLDERWNNTEKWTLKDINIGNELHKNNYNEVIQGSIVNRKKIPHIIVSEFQPNSFKKMVFYMKLVKRQVRETAAHLKNIIINASNSSSAIKELLESTFNGDIGGVSTAGDFIAEEILVDYNNYDEDIFGKPIKNTKFAFNGKYIRSYEIPFNSNYYITANGAAGWSNLMNNNINLGKNMISSLYKVASNLPTFDQPFVPNWVSSKNAQSYYALETEYHLVNNNIENLAKNFQFLSHLFQGCMWMQYDTFRVPPNVYSIEIPGFLFIQFASLRIEVTSVGNRRRLSEDQYNVITNETGFNIFNGELVEKDSIFLPDAWKVNMTFNSLMPNNYNTLMNYFKFGTGAFKSYRDDIQVGEFIINGKNNSGEHITSNDNFSKLVTKGGK